MSTPAGQPGPPSLGFEIVGREEIAEQHLRLKLRGHLDADSAHILSRNLSEIVDNGGRMVDLDFSEVAFISSTGLGSLIAAVGEYRDVGGDIVFHGLSSELREVFAMLDLMDYITLK